MCSETDYEFTDNQGHEYYANICGDANHNCLPQSWQNNLEYGVALQMWGDQPPQDQKNCQHKVDGSPAPCTKDCQVIGHGFPEYDLRDMSNPSTGGVLVQFKTVPPADDDPFFCPWDVEHGRQYPREVHYVMMCDKSVKGAVPVQPAEQNSTDNCRYTVTFKTPYACASGPASKGLGGGAVFGIIFGVFAGVFALYCIGGMAMGYATQRTVRIPHQAFWSGLGAKVASPFSKSSSSGARGTYEDIGTGQAGGYQGSEKAGGNSYTDL